MIISHNWLAFSCWTIHHIRSLVKADYFFKEKEKMIFFSHCSVQQCNWTIVLSNRPCKAFLYLFKRKYKLFSFENEFISKLLWFTSVESRKKKCTPQQRMWLCVFSINLCANYAYHFCTLRYKNDGLVHQKWQNCLD